MAAGIVFRPLLGIGEHRVGRGDLLEALLGAGRLVAVRVIGQGEAAEGILDGLGIGIPRDAQDLVVVPLGGWIRNGVTPLCLFLVLGVHHLAPRA
jgi:hypothetical protein